MSATKQYIQAETSSRIDACFGGVVVEHESHKFQYYQDRNKRWPFTCSEKGYALLTKLMTSVTPVLKSIRQEITDSGKNIDETLEKGREIYREETRHQERRRHVVARGIRRFGVDF
ncbi:unnamed protein product [Bathycoccus prasinos]